MKPNDTLWRGKKCAVCLTYDDALNVHLDHAVPLLEALGLRATFYIWGCFPAFGRRLADWKRPLGARHAKGCQGGQGLHLVDRP